MIYTNENYIPPVTYCEPNKAEVQRMSKQEAIEYIQEWLKDKYALNGKDRVVLNMAIEALQDDRIPVSERLPEDGYWLWLASSGEVKIDLYSSKSEWTVCLYAEENNK